MKSLLRNILIIIFSIFAIQANAANISQANSLIEGLGNSINKIISKKNLDEKTKMQQIVVELDNIIDAEWMARFVLGKHFKTLNKDQQQNFIKIYREYLVKIYAPKIKGYSGLKFNIIQALEQGNFIIVKAEFFPLNGNKINMNFKIKQKEEKSKIVDFIAEGVDQTRGWFYTLHALAVLLFDSVAYKTVVSNGLVLDKNGVKMSKRLGNIVDPFDTITKYGADATRWYLITNASPWDSLKFDIKNTNNREMKGLLHNHAINLGFIFDKDKSCYVAKVIEPVVDIPLVSDEIF